MYVRFRRDLLETSWRECHENATRKLLPWNLSYTEPSSWPLKVTKRNQNGNNFTKAQLR